jgi:hypothetical protein
MTTLVQPLFEGPIDVVADVHGESEALEELLGHLGYAAGGRHPAGRRLVFLGDLVDRGPDSPAVLRRVVGLVERGLAQCLLGNHELNILLGRHKPDNVWFFGHEGPEEPGKAGPQKQADKQTRTEALAFFGRLPLALQGIGLRVVHACWHPAMIELVRHETDAKELYARHKQAIEKELEGRRPVDEMAVEMAKQNENPVKVLTSGLEEPAPQRYYLNGKWRVLQRATWWQEYRDPVWCVVGHYSRRKLPDEDGGGDRLCGETDPAGKQQYAPLGGSRVLCIDYSAGYRSKERQTPGFDGRHHARLAALRYPEMQLMFDDGTTEAVAGP